MKKTTYLILRRIICRRPSRGRGEANKRNLHEHQTIGDRGEKGMLTCVSGDGGHKKKNYTSGGGTGRSNVKLLRGNRPKKNGKT